jgi:hypothetical protein
MITAISEASHEKKWIKNLKKRKKTKKNIPPLFSMIISVSEASQEKKMADK